ncbi:hypothetical protein E4U09_006535 [Claviceps aff. purpurea]|uniref:Uncharacterized protein n=1 Tax=Claviceps aff. purpurea TaxID=1967640 RepID=A0A9P7QR58_9HYPO|nr:hypothetical protein E4U09_006535 [Claviceps aff. purpurea]
MKLSILVTSLLSLGASALPEAEESITVGEYTYTGGDLPKGELKVSMYSPCVTWKNDAAAHLGLARGGVFANLAVANAGATMAAIHAMADGTGISQVVTAYASNNMQMDSGKTLIATTTLGSGSCDGSRPGTDAAKALVTRRIHELASLRALPWSRGPELEKLHPAEP